MIYHIYKATNKENEKSYVGVSYQPVERIKIHIGSRGKCHFHNALRKYGEDAFDWEILDYTTNRAQAYIWLEKYWISRYDTFNNGYNMTKGGEGSEGRIPWNKGKTGLQTAWNKGRKHNEESIRKMSEAKTGKLKTEEHRRKISESMLGKLKSVETRRRMSESKKGNQYAAKARTTN